MSAHTSLILALHARFEAASYECNALDNGTLRAARPTAERLEQLRAAISDSINEQDALRLAILMQVPNTTAEAAVLTFHISVARDAEETATDREREALTLAIDTLFDFMACEAAGAVQGKDFATLAERVRERRRLRTGEMEAA